MTTETTRPRPRGRPPCPDGQMTGFCCRFSAAEMATLSALARLERRPQAAVIRELLRVAASAIEPAKAARQTPVQWLDSRVGG